MGYPIPIKLLIKNFKSHKSTIIPLGQVDDKCYTMGISGSGKSSILEAIQYALGKNIDNAEEFFHYTNIKEEDTIHYEDVALIELTVVNTGPDFLHTYNENEELTIVLEAFNGKNNKRYIRRENGTTENITIPNLKQFGNYKDPLIFVDDSKTSIWSMFSPKQRYTEVAKFMKIEEFENNVKLAKKGFKNAEKILDKADDDLNIAYIDFKSIKEKYNRYLTKQEKEKEMQQIKLEHLKAKLFENIEQFQELQGNLNYEAEKIEELVVKRERLRNQIKTDEGKIETIRTNTQGQVNKRNELNSKRNELYVEVTNFDSQYFSIKKELEISIKELPNQGEISEIQNQLKKIKILVAEKSLKIGENKNQRRKYESELELRKRDKLPLNKDITQLQNGLQKNNIPYEILAKTLDIQKGHEDWIDYLEVALGNLRLGILVEEKNRLEAQKINRSLNTNAFLLYPVKKYAKIPNINLRSWNDLLSIETTKIPKNTVIDFLNLIMNSTYFADSPIQKEEYLKIRPRSTIFCRDGFTYRIYSQRKVNFRRLSHYIGKGASERQIKILENNILETENLIKILEDEVVKLRKEQRIKEISLDFIDLSLKEAEMIQKKKDIKKMDETILDLNISLSDPQGKVRDLQIEITRNTELRNTSKEDLVKSKANFTDFQSDTTNVSIAFSTLFNKFYIEHESLLEGVDLSMMQVLETFKDKDYEYKGINGDIISILNDIQRPKDNSKTLGFKIQTINEVLKTYKDLPDDIVKKYETQKLKIESIEKEIDDFSNDKLTCQEKFNRAVENLENELRKWERIVSKKFQDILIGLNLDGILTFSKVGEGQYELDISVSKVEGGKPMTLERSGFSKGQRRRVSIAFQTAILTQSDSSFFVWDEFDEGLDNYHRELLAKMIQKHLHNKKLIGITPIHPIKGYLETFDWIIELFLDENENSQVQIIKFSDKIKKEEKKIDAF